MLGPDAILNERYRLIEQIGEGGMATVYRALDTRLGRTVAIKVLHPEYARDRPFLQRFQQEAEFAASLGAHPNIVAIYDIGQDGGLPYIVMELIEGRTLKDMIRERAPFTVPEAYSIARQVASALDFAHGRGLVHRDIKPQNIMVTDDGSAKVTDFGIAQSVTASQLTRTGTVIGTVHYFSPEQARGKPAAPASDIYSLGIILYEMLTGHLPFDADNAIGVAMKHLHDEPPSPWTYNARLPAGAVATIMRALEKDPERRYRDAAEFAAALAPPARDLGGTTAVSPIVPEVATEPTARFAPIEPQPVPRRVVREPVVRRAAPASTGTTVAAPTNPWRTSWLALAGFLAVLIIAVLGFFFANRIFGASGATATPTPTSTPSPTATPRPKKHTPTPVPTQPVVVPTQPIVPTSPPPTFTPVPPNTPTPTPHPKPQPTDTSPPPVATDTPSVQFIGNTPTPTPTG